MSHDNLKVRTKAFGLKIIQLVESLPSGRTADILGRQLLRSGTSVGANYRSACRARSIADFIAKMGIVEEEADESAYWLEIMRERELMQSETLAPLLAEANELVAIAIASIKTARKRKP